MTQHIYRIHGFYRGASKSPLVFTVSAPKMHTVRLFVKAYIPNFVIMSIAKCQKQEATHYTFADVNPVISAHLHLGDRRRTGSVIHRHAHPLIN